MVVLDATAGNRHLWGKNSENINTVFVDKEYGLKIPPNLFADFTMLPFRSNIFECVIFDPPHYTSPPPWFDDPKENRMGRQGPFYGIKWRKNKLIKSLHLAQEEFARVSDRLCFRWFEFSITIWKILSIFTIENWKEIYRTRIKGPSNHKSDGCWWVTFIRKRERT